MIGHHAKPPGGQTAPEQCAALGDEDLVEAYRHFVSHDLRTELLRRLGERHTLRAMVARCIEKMGEWAHELREGSDS